MRSKWLALCGGISSVMAASAVLSFPLLLHIDSSLDTRAISAYTTTVQHASWLCILSAFLYEDFGARTIVLALVLLPLGYLGLAFIDIGVPGENVVGIGTIVAATGQGACISYTISVLFLIDLFDSGRSRVLGFLACTNNITMLLYYASFTLFHLELAHFYLVVAGVTFVLMTVATVTFCVVPMYVTSDLEKSKEKRILTKLSLVCLAISWIMISSLLCRDNLPAKIFLIVLGWLSPAGYLVGVYLDEKIPVVISFHEVGAEQGGVVQREETVTLFRAMKRNSFWLMFFTTAVIVGSGATLRNNLFDIIKYVEVAIRWEPDTYYTLMSTMEAFAALLSGVLAERIQPRLMLCGLCFLCSAAMFMLYMGLRFSFLFGVVFTGMSFGALQTLLPVMIYEEFGRVQFSRKYGFMLLGYSMGALILSTAISSQAYFVHVGGDRAQSCEGDTCFSISFAINCAASCLAAVAMLSLAQAKPHQRRVEPPTDVEASRPGSN